jgi:hypothetical protein
VAHLSVDEGGGSLDHFLVAALDEQSLLRWTVLPGCPKHSTRCAWRR